MESFNFHPELFEVRNEVLEFLADHGFVWLSDFSAIDLMHDIYGIEVCGIPEERNAGIVEKLLRKKFPAWTYYRTYYNDYDSRDIGWKVVISRDPEDFGDDWGRVG